MNLSRYTGLCCHDPSQKRTPLKELHRLSWDISQLPGGHALRSQAGIQIESAAPLGLLDVMIVLSDSWKRIATTVGVCLIVGILASYFIVRPSYESTAVILPPPLPQSLTSTLTGQVSSANKSKMSAETYVGILYSQTVMDRVIAKLHLQSIWKLKTPADTRTALRSEIEIEPTTFDSIQIIVRDHDAKLASDLANQFVSELNIVDNDLSRSEAAHRRIFFDHEVTLEKKALGQAEDKLKATQQLTALISPQRQAYQAIQNIDRLRTEIANRIVALQSMRSYATDINPDVIRLKAEIEGLQRQLSLQQDNLLPHLPGDIQVPASQFADRSLEYQRALREVNQREILMDLVFSQAEAARIDQAKSAPTAPMIDPAAVADKKIGPQRTLLWAACCWVGITAACLGIFLKQAMMRTRQNPDKWRSLLRLREALGTRMYLGRKAFPLI